MVRKIAGLLALTTLLACGGGGSRSTVVAVAVVGEASLTSTVDVLVNNGNDTNPANATMIRSNLRGGESWDTRSLPDNPAGRLTFIVKDVNGAPMNRQVNVPMDVPQGARLTIRVRENAVNNLLSVEITG